MSQETYEQRVEREIITLKKEGWQSLTMGIMIHATSFVHMSDGRIPGGKHTSGFLAFNTIGLGLDIMSFTKFIKANRLEKKMSRPKL